MRILILLAIALGGCTKAKAGTAPAPSSSAQAEAGPVVAVDTAAIRKAVADEWAHYDALPTKTKASLTEAIESAGRKAKELPDQEAQAAEQSEIAAAGRDRMAPLIQSETRAAGDHRTTLIPSADQRPGGNADARARR
jgi:hypothetical protein